MIDQRSIFRHWDSRWMLAAMLILGVVASLLGRLETLLVLLGFTLLLAGLARIRLIWLLGRLGLVGIALLPMGLILPWSSDHGTEITIRIGLRCFAITIIGLIIYHAATVSRLLAAASRLGIPSVILRTTQLASRYSELLFHELRQMRLAARLRGLVWRSNLVTYRALGQITGTMFVRGLDRSDRIADAMICRGFDGRYLTVETMQARWHDPLGFLLITTIAGSLLIWDRLT